jgi:hypothetical protein
MHSLEAVLKMAAILDVTAVCRFSTLIRRAQGLSGWMMAIERFGHILGTVTSF